jgi:hypothetical protein
VTDKFIPHHGIEQDIVPANGTDYTLDEVQAFVGGYIEVVGFGNGVMMLVVNEDGQAQHLPINERASLIAGQSIVGNVVLIEKDRLK